MGASSDTPSHSQMQKLLDELREMRRTVERLEQSIVTLPARRDAERRERRSKNYEFLLGLLGSAMLGILIGLTLIFIGWRIFILVGLLPS